jgi:uncharacterized protein YecE (DUF72 family)
VTIRVGTSSWTDPTLTKDADFYPKKTMSAEERLRYYASIFTAVEVDATYYAPPSRHTATSWVERTPDDFRMDIKAYSLFTQHPTRVRGMWSDLGDELSPEARAKGRVYLSHLGPEMVDEAWARFDHALRPLHDAGKLASVVFQWPPWFVAKRGNREYLESLPSRLPDYRIAVEFRHGSWLSEDDRDRTLDLLRDLGLCYVSVDEPQGFATSVPPVVAATADFALVRFHGHNAENWQKKGITPAERFRYLYSEAELREWVAPIRELAASTSETHALMNNCYRDYGTTNARQLGELLGEGLQPEAI